MAILIKRTQGLGDAIFALGAAYGLYQKTSADIQFMGPPGYQEWIDWVDFVSPPSEGSWDDEFDLDAIPSNHPGDRAEFYANYIGVSSPVFPFEFSTPPLHRENRYIVSAPFCAGDVPTRSLRSSLVVEMAHSFTLPITLVDNNDHPEMDSIANTNNLCGSIGLSWVIRYIAGAEVFIGVDAGLAYVAAAMGTPTVVIFTHINPQTRIKHIPCVVVQAQYPDCVPCGDFSWPDTPCMGQLGACAAAIEFEQIETAVGSLGIDI